MKINIIICLSKFSCYDKDSLQVFQSYLTLENAICTSNTTNKTMVHFHNFKSFLNRTMLKEKMHNHLWFDRFFTDLYSCLFVGNVDHFYFYSVVQQLIFTIRLKAPDYDLEYSWKSFLLWNLKCESFEYPLFFITQTLFLIIILPAKTFTWILFPDSFIKVVLLNLFRTYDIA